MFEGTCDPLSWIPSYKGKSVPFILKSFIYLIRYQLELSKILTFTVFGFHLYMTVLLCNGLQDDSILVDLAAALASEGVNVFRFDFAGNG
jgi:hypothetical protein